MKSGPCECELGSKQARWTSWRLQESLSREAVPESESGGRVQVLTRLDRRAAGSSVVEEAGGTRPDLTVFWEETKCIQHFPRRGNPASGRGDLLVPGRLSTHLGVKSSFLAFAHFTPVVLTLAAHWNHPVSFKKKSLKNPHFLGSSGALVTRAFLMIPGGLNLLAGLTVTGLVGLGYTTHV